jgi:NAD(P)H dehydrogenase (quinone)
LLRDAALFGLDTEEGAQAACWLLGKRLAEWVAVFCDGRKDQHPLNKSDTRLSPG